MTEVLSLHVSRTTRYLRDRFGPVDLLDNLPVGICCCDAEGVLVQFNKHAAELWGRSPQVGAQRFTGAERIFDPDGRQLPLEAIPIARVLQTGKPVRNATVMVDRPDGTRVSLIVNAEPLRDDDKIVGAVSCFQDVTNLSRKDEPPNSGNEVLEDFFEHAPIGLHVVAGDGTILRANKAELELLGYSAEEYVGRPVADFHADEHVVEEILARLSRDEVLDRYPARMRAKDGSIRHVLLTSNAEVLDGKLVKTRCFVLDDTGRKLAEARERITETRARAALASVPVAVYMTDAEGRIIFFNEAYERLIGRKPEPDVDRFCSAWRIYTPEGEPIPREDCLMAVALKEQRPISGMEVIIERPDGTRVSVLPHPTPISGGDGSLIGAVNVMVDITDRHETDAQLAHLAAIVASSDDAIISKSLDGRITSWNAGATRIFGYEEQEVVGKPITLIVPPELHDQELAMLEKLRRGERVDHFETVRVAKDGRRVDISLTVSPIRDRLGRVIGASKVSRDITERKRHEELQKLLIGELNHRVKNTLATVQAIATQTVRSANSPAEFMSGFSGRLQSLARAHSALTRGNWQGVDVEDLLRDQLLLGGAEDEQIAYSGPQVVLEPQVALHLALVLHELGTNARKYGALSVPTGRLMLRWAVRGGCDEKLLLSWQERGGPPVKPPRQRGFGSMLIEQSLEAQGGRVSVAYPVEGVTCEISLPLPDSRRPAISAGRVTSDSARPTASLGDSLARSAPGKNPRVLIVEDEPLVSMDVAMALSDAGCGIVGPAANLDKARELIAGDQFEVAILDANLSGEPVDELAAELTRRGIPFAFLTGYGLEGIPREFRTAPLIDKPFNPGQLVAVVEALIAGKA